MYTYKKSGIYSIKNLVTGKRYIGSAFDLSGRKATHFYQLRKKKHHNIYLQRSFLKYREENFKFEVLMYCEKEELIKYEQIFIDYYKSEKTYNIRKEACNNFGLHHTKKTKNKISKTIKDNSINKGEKNGMYGMSGNKNPFYGKTHSEETKKLISEKNKGKLNQLGEKNHNFGNLRKGGLSNFHGVYFVKSKNHWRAVISINGKCHYIKSSKNETDAALAYDKYIRDNNLPYPLNFPE